VVQLLHILGGVLSHPAGPSTLVKRHIGAGVSHGGVHGGHWLARRAVPHNLLDAAQAAHAAVQDAARTIHTRLQPSFDPLDSHPPYSHTTSVSMFIPTTSGGSESHVSAPTGSPHDAAPFVVITEQTIQKGRPRGTQEEQSIKSEKTTTTSKDAASGDGSQKPSKPKTAERWSNPLQRLKTALRNLSQRIKQSWARFIQRVFARGRANNPPSDVELTEIEKAQAARAAQSSGPSNKPQDPGAGGSDQQSIADHVNANGPRNTGDGKTSTLPHQQNHDAHDAQKTMAISGHPEQPEQQKEHAQVQQGVASEKSAADSNGSENENL